MNKEEYEERMRRMLTLAHGRWTMILGECGVDHRLLKHRNGPCPIADCGGKDRFQYTDKFGEGNYFCRACGAGGGFKLLQHWLRLSAGDTLRTVEKVLNMLPEVPTPSGSQRSTHDVRRSREKIWKEGHPIKPGDEVDRYLENRGIALEQYPVTLRFHPALPYFIKDEHAEKYVHVGDYAAMLACLQAKDGSIVALHRTYLLHGQKAPVDSPKKLLGDTWFASAVRLGEPSTELSVAEGLENAIAIYKRNGPPVWSALTAGNLEKIWIPDTIKRLRIFGDNDANRCFDGQAAAFSLARRLKKGRHTATLTVEVLIPEDDGADWVNVLAPQFSYLNQAA